MLSTPPTMTAEEMTVPPRPQTDEERVRDVALAHLLTRLLGELSAIREAIEDIADSSKRKPKSAIQHVWDSTHVWARSGLLLIAAISMLVMLFPSAIERAARITSLILGFAP